MDVDEEEALESTCGADWFNHLPANAGPDHHDISSQAVWTLSSCKAGFGIHELLSDSHESYWQSDGPQPHSVTIEFPRKTDISFLFLYLDFKTDESYTPNKVTVHLGSCIMHLDDGLSVNFDEPQGWQVIDLRSRGKGKAARAWVVQLQVLTNHQNGRDTHIRHMRVVGPKSRYAHQVEDSFMAQLRLSGPTSSGRNTKNERKQSETPAFLILMSIDEISESVPDLLESLTSGQKKLVDFIEELRPFVTSKDDLKREAGINTIRHLSCNTENFSKEAAFLLMQDVFLQGNIQSWPQRTRADFYAIFEMIVTKFEKELKMLGSDVTSAFINMMGGERDPRCLVQAFRLHLRISSRFPLGDLAEDLFEVIACYYPIEFKPLPGQEDVTSDMLTIMVENSFLAHSAFGPYLYVMIEEKLRDEETTQEQKFNVCSLLAKACKTFPPTLLLPHIEHIFGAIRMVALNPKYKGTLKLDGNLTEALVSVFMALQATERDDLKATIKEFMQNCEPFVVQVEMGLQSKALALLEALTDERLNQHSSDERVGKMVLEYIISWLVLVVRGQTINVAENKAECIKEALERLSYFVAFAANNGYEALLYDLFLPILDAVQCSREWVPIEAKICNYKCLQEYARFINQNPSIFSVFSDELKAGIKLVDTEQERKEYLSFVTCFAKNVREWNAVWTIIQSCSDLNISKYFATICAATIDEDSYKTIRKIIQDSLNTDDFSAQIQEILKMVTRLNEGIIVSIIEQLIEFATKETHWETLPDLVELFATSLQEIGTYLDESHAAITMKVSEMSAMKPIYQKIFYLFVAQTQEVNHLRKLMMNEQFELDARLLFFYSLINRTQATSTEIPVNLSPKEHELFQTYFVKAALLNGPWNQRGSPECKELLSRIASGSISSDGTELLRIIFDFTSSKFDPIRGKYKRSILYQQRIFFLFLQTFDSTIEDLNEESKMKLISTISPFLHYAQNVPDAGQALEKLQPLLINALASPLLATLKDDRAQFFAALTFLLAITKLADKSRAEIEVLLALFGRELEQEANMATIVNSLNGLEILASEANPVYLQAHINKVVTVVIRFTAHKKRIVRQKAAKVINLWELLLMK
ncbi:unnamed protein product, partial [Mesorhabditis belari]|uniref:Anaphase-promoting complex subunit 10 n=1 Tax=Mesorhabditis belari TaxID=2138241 RepID=A0AAF3J423_9BILA